MIDWTSCSWLGFMIKRCTERVSHPYSSKCTAPPTHTVPGRITHVPPMTTRGGFRGGRRSQGYQWLTITLEKIQHRDNREKDLILVCNSRNNIWTLNFLNQYPEYIWALIGSIYSMTNMKPKNCLTFIIMWRISDLTFDCNIIYVWTQGLLSNRKQLTNEQCLQNYLLIQLWFVPRMKANLYETLNSTSYTD